MPNGATHTMVAALAVGGLVTVTSEEGDEHAPGKIVASGAVAVAGSKLPDLLEPALNPHHRQFFHSLVFAAAVGMATCKIYQWEPQTKHQEWIRLLLLAGAAGYLIHLVMDGCTPRSLPLIGRLPGLACG